MELAKRLLSNLFPSRCLLCHKTIVSQSDNGNHESIEICPECLAKLPYNEVSCRRCAVPLVAEVEGERLCGRCIKKLPAFDYAYSPLHYEDDVIRLMHQFKFREKIAFSRTLGEIMLECWQMKTMKSGNVDTPDCLLPVPLHKSRMRQRGFNQSIELSRVIAKKLNIPIEYDAVSRTRSTSAQTGLNSTQRRKNIKGAFKVVQKIPAKHVLIIDDVMTTGSTVNELARILKKAGVEQVGVLCLARAPIKN
jgi:ComF family protein